MYTFFGRRTRLWCPKSVHKLRTPSASPCLSPRRPHARLEGQGAVPFAVGTARRHSAAEAEAFVLGVADRHLAPRSRQLEQRHQLSMRGRECDDAGTGDRRTRQGRGPAPCRRAAGARKSSRGAAGLGRGRAAGKAEPWTLPMTALRLTPPRRRATVPALRPSSQSAVSRTTRFSVQPGPDGLTVLSGKVATRLGAAGAGKL